MKITEADEHYIQQVAKESGMTEERVISVLIQNASAWAGFLDTRPDVKDLTYSTMQDHQGIDQEFLDDMFKILKYM